MIFGAKFPRPNNVRVVIPRNALEAVFDECDRYDADETGGRIIGSYSERAGQLTISVSGIIEPGPSAKRSNTSFFQDGAFQERVFREIEREHPEIEHLGNWHTHHVNRFPHLSSGDIATYTRTVNHEKHNTSFFYALLVTEKEPAHSRQRYRVRHYILRRGENKVFEIDGRHVDVTDGPLLWPGNRGPSISATQPTATPAAAAIDMREARYYDAVVLKDLYGRLRAFSSQTVGLYWRGPIELVDGTDMEVVLLEDASGRQPEYRIGLPQPRAALTEIIGKIGERRFTSARTALIHAERACNRAILEHERRTSLRGV